MKPELLSIICCPLCKGHLELRNVFEQDGEVESGLLHCIPCAESYPVVRFIPRFVPVDNYATNFGLQWNRFRQTQLDSHSRLPISRERFFRQSGWSPNDLAGKNVLDVGCGAGRFAEIVLSCKANLFAIDYSSAVDACWQNLGPHPSLNVVQGDIYHLPFKPGSFDFVYCFGVLQHTPDVKRAFMALPVQLCEGGRLAVDLYPKQSKNLFWPKYWLRGLTKRMVPSGLFKLVQWMVKLLFPISFVLGRFPVFGHKLRYFIPIANYDGVYPLSNDQLREWAILDTFDMLAPRYDQPQSAQKLTEWFVNTGLKRIDIFRAGVLVGRGVKIAINKCIE